MGFLQLTVCRGMNLVEYSKDISGVAFGISYRVGLNFHRRVNASKNN